MSIEAMNLVKPVLARNLTTGNILEFESVEAAARFGFVPSSIYRCCYGICKKHRGYEFAFKNPSHADGKKAITHPAPGVPVGYVPVGYVLVPLQVLRDASDALGNFINDLGWDDSDMQAWDNLDAYIAQHPAYPSQKG